MCGIVGYTGKISAAPVILDGLARLEYRGYDSAGIAILTSDGVLDVRKEPGKLKNLVEESRENLPHGFTGIGHTRWATHGAPTGRNAHPHVDCRGEIAVVHNGIVENYLDLKAELMMDGHVFVSDTDTEAIAHLLEQALSSRDNLVDALSSVGARLRGANAIVAMWKRYPGALVAVRLGNAGGVTIGYTDRGMLLSSDLPALIPYTNQVVFLEDGDIANVTGDRVVYSNLQGETINKQPQFVQIDANTAYKGGHAHYMLKEILEQPLVVTSALRERLSFDSPEVLLQDFPLTKPEVNSLRRVVLIGMGTSHFACQVARLWMERFTGLPTEVDNASEFRYREPVLDRNTLVVSVGQSGETADTLAGMKEAGRRGARLIAVANVEGSQASRLAEGTLFIRAGVEIGVAATKTFTASLATLYMLAVYLGDQRGYLSREELTAHVQGLASLPSLLGRMLKDPGAYSSLAERFFQSDHFLYLGRGVNYPVAMEGALKLKEVSYIHAEGYPAGEMKHGPIALIDARMPVVALALKDSMYEKNLVNISEVKARGGTVIAVGTEGDTRLASLVDYALYVPQVPEMLSPVLSVVPLQMFAYELAVWRGCDIDQPRNLAKTVTVE